MVKDNNNKINYLDRILLEQNVRDFAFEQKDIIHKVNIYKVIKEIDNYVKSNIGQFIDLDGNLEQTYINIREFSNDCVLEYLSESSEIISDPIMSDQYKLISLQESYTNPASQASKTSTYYNPPPVATNSQSKFRKGSNKVLTWGVPLAVITYILSDLDRRFLTAEKTPVGNADSNKGPEDLEVSPEWTWDSSSFNPSNWSNPFSEIKPEWKDAFNPSNLTDGVDAIEKNNADAFRNYLMGKTETLTDMSKTMLDSNKIISEKDYSVIQLAYSRLVGELEKGKSWFDKVDSKVGDSIERFIKTSKKSMDKFEDMVKHPEKITAKIDAAEAAETKRLLEAAESDNIYIALGGIAIGLLTFGYITNREFVHMKKVDFIIDRLVQNMSKIGHRDIINIDNRLKSEYDKATKSNNEKGVIPLATSANYKTKYIMGIILAFATIYMMDLKKRQINTSNVRSIKDLLNIRSDIKDKRIEEILNKAYNEFESYTNIIYRNKKDKTSAIYSELNKRIAEIKNKT
jgi:hypothetical protein